VAKKEIYSSMAKANYRAMETNMCKYICDDIVCVYFVSRMLVFFLFSQFWLVWMEKNQDKQQNIVMPNEFYICYSIFFFFFFFFKYLNLNFGRFC
jgi:hypothetical protein